MDTLSQLSSRNGDRTSASNRAVADRCIAQPALLVEVAAGLDFGDAGVAADCAEVFTMVAENRPEYVAPYADRLTALLSHNNTHARWEATHAIALVAANSPEAIALKLPRLAEMICKDASIIVRDYAVDAVAGYAQSSPVAARQAYPILREALTLWNGKHAHHALRGLANAFQNAPELMDELTPVALSYLNDSRTVVRKAAKALLLALQASRPAAP